jgi:glycosyltransferase A (GT-A) superfamily protein (DUF2064 family)
MISPAADSRAECGGSGGVATSNDGVHGSAGAQNRRVDCGRTEEQMRNRLGNDPQYTEQGDGDLGERMARAFQGPFDSGAEQVVIIGSDCPSNHWKNRIASSAPPPAAAII